MVIEGDGVLRRTGQIGNPIDVGFRQTKDPIVIDLNGLVGKRELQRFVVATVLRQLIDQRTGKNATDGLVYLVVLDELNRFAPKGSRDSITRLIEQVAAEMRSQGIILLSAQQQASKVSETVIENAGVRAVGRSGTLEMEHAVWRGLNPSARRKAASLPIDEKLIVQDSFREAMHVRVPFPAWAMRKGEAEPYDFKRTRREDTGIDSY
jgi:DNA helicase HerA-like ATPase